MNSCTGTSLGPCPLQSNKVPAELSSGEAVSHQANRADTKSGLKDLVLQGSEPLAFSHFIDQHCAKNDKTENDLLGVAFHVCEVHSILDHCNSKSSGKRAEHPALSST